MKVLKKGETVAECVNAVRIARRIGFHVSGTFIFALPTETHEERMSCVRMSRELGLNLVRFNNATPYPGTELYEMAKREGRLHVQGLYENFSAVSTFIENPFRKIPYSYVPTGTTERAIRNDIMFSYFAFYINWDKIKKIFTQPDTNETWFNAGRSLRDRIKRVPAMVFLAFMMLVKFIELLFNTLFGNKDSVSARDLFKLFSGRWFKKAGTGQA
jgi:radical SAM superfamily enzyme YgiQ (UPF0313 family)